MWFLLPMKGPRAGRARRRARQGGTAARLRVESLDDRTVPSFLGPISHPVGASEAYSVAVGDFNLDSAPDLAVVGPGDAVSVLLGNGDGTFRPGASYRVGNRPTAVAVGDLNRDSRPDIVTANYLSGTVSVLLGNGDGTFQSAPDYGVGFGATGVAVADVNRDSQPDVVALRHETALTSDGSVSVFLGNGDGTLQAPRNTGVGVYPDAMAVGDLNADGKLDLAVTLEGTPAWCDAYSGTCWPAVPGSVKVLLGNGDGTFSTGNTYGLSGLYGMSATSVEQDGDATADLVVSVEDSRRLDVFLGKGDGTFEAPRTNDLGVSPQAVAASDFNADGRPDLVTANVG